MSVAQLSSRLTLLCLLSFVIAPLSAHAEIANFDLGAKIYTKWLYQNNDRQGLLWLGHPAEKDNYSGDNGVGSEFELLIKGKVTKYVTAGVRIKSRFGALWHNWWENGDMRAVPDNSGESLGMNHAEYIRLRGYWFRIQELPIPTLKYIHIGSSDYSQFNEWTIGKIRYISRDNGKGIFFDGGVGDKFSYHFGIIPLPKLWIGPGWTTGLGDTAVANPFYSQDYAYAAKLKIEPLDSLSIVLIGAVALDWEANRLDPDAVGTLNPNGLQDGQVDLVNRFYSLSTTADVKIELTDTLTAYLLFAFSDNRINGDYATNRIPEGGFYNLVWSDSQGIALRGRFFAEDPFEIGLTFKFEGFYIGSHYNAAFGARREADVLLTDGFLGGGQLPTLNVANEFMDFDEPWAESIIGWAGGTMLVDYSQSIFTMQLEGTFITYTTNNPINPNTGELIPRDVDVRHPTYPGLHTGVTDPDFFNNINRQDFGRDPRSVYRKYQSRWTVITRLSMQFDLPIKNGMKLLIQGKYIHDEDTRQLKRDDDDYVGDLIYTKVGASMPVNDWLHVEAGFGYDLFLERRVFGNDEQGYSTFVTNKYKPYLKLRINFGGVKIAYYLQYVRRDLLRDRHIANPEDRVLDDRVQNVWRSKATAEVAW